VRKDQEPEEVLEVEEEEAVEAELGEL
jgi:hypothetical protein